MSRLVIDCETDDLNATVIHLLVAKDIDTGEVHVCTDYPSMRSVLSDARVCIGHNIIGFDAPTINRLVGNIIDSSRCIDTLVVSRLLNFDQQGGHSLESWGLRFGLPKIEFNDYSKLTEKMVEYCKRDVDITHSLYLRFLPYISSVDWKSSLRLEHDSAIICREMEENGFTFDINRATILLKDVRQELAAIDQELAKAFPPRPYPIKQITPRATAKGTLNATDFRWIEDRNLSSFEVGWPFTRIDWEPFNAGSPKQIVERLNEAGWKPFDKTKGHLKAEKERNKEALERFRVYGWKVNEDNLTTLPQTAPSAAHSLRRRLILDSRRSTLEEWINNYNEHTNRIHGRFYHIGTWTHRMSHASPNMANVPGILDKFGSPSVLGHEFRALWGCPDTSWLIGVDADGIQSRVLAHYLSESGDHKLRDLLESGVSIHDQHVIALGDPCKSRASAKRFYYAWLLGAGVGQVADILQCSNKDARASMQSFTAFYPGLRDLERRYEKDAARGYFIGLDGRKVLCDSAHYMKAAYLQNGESVIMKHTNRIWRRDLQKHYRDRWKQVNFVHDEWEVEFSGPEEEATHAGGLIRDSFDESTSELQLLCPIRGGTPKVGKTWADVH